jgi:hypothetical protein
MEHSEETATKAESQSSRVFHLIFDGGIVEREFFEAVFEFIVFGGVDRIDSSVDERGYSFESRDEIVLESIFQFQKIPPSPLS